ncbi:MAG: phosphatase PAP2 family protein [Candidatus Thorarchaeota archaeon]
MPFDPEITILLRDLIPWAGEVFKLISEVGDFLFYMAVILIAYWTFGKREAILTSVVMMVSLVSNYWLKYAIANPRPPNTPPNNYWYEGVEATNFSTPSGHAHNSATFYGWISAKAKTWWMLLVSVILVFLIGLSRVYLGVHYLGDVLLGWAIGIATVLVILQIEKPLTNFASQYKSQYLWLNLSAFAFVLTLISSFLPYPPDDNFGAYGGLVMGLGVAVPLEQKYVGFAAGSEIRRSTMAVRVVIGLVLAIGLMLGLSGLLPTANIWLRALRYFLVVLVGVFVWPLLFNKAGL